MSKINQIQSAILELDGGAFQKLADAYLVVKGYGRINSIGSVVAANKVKKGTPDTLFATANGGYIFAEHTTKQSALLKKMKADLKKCFDEGKTGVPVTKIERVIFCFTGKLNADEEYQLNKICQPYNICPELIGIDALSYDLYINYPGIALDFLGISVDTGQIVTTDQFVSLYNTSRFATRLDLGFHFREQELASMIDTLDHERLVVLSGHPGVGKSRLALEVCRKFIEIRQEFQALCIFGRNRDLWEDLQTWFRRPGNFLVFVDDANRLSKFEYIIDLLQYQREDQQFKVVVTVRDYALAKIKESAKPLGDIAVIELKPFTDEQITKLITDEFKIVNYHYLKRISDIARGNPRIAVMASEIAKENSLDSINDVSTLYDSYFSSIREDLKNENTDLKNSNYLKVAAIVSFFKSVDRTNEEMMTCIEKAFNITIQSFWEDAEWLHRHEILDMYENEVVRMSDQVLGAYLFYLASFKENALDFGNLLDYFFPRLRSRLIDSINPVLNAFDSKLIINVMRPHIERIQNDIMAAGNLQNLIHLLEVFWFVNRTETLLKIMDLVEKLEPETVDMSLISFTKSTNAVSSPSILNVLKSFAYAEKEESKMALELLMRYLDKRPLEVPALLRILIENFGFRPDSYLRGFEIQYAVSEVLWNKAKDGNPLFAKLFLTVSNNFLETEHEDIRSKDNRTVQITRFELPVTQEIIILRKVIWERLMALYKNDGYKNDVIEVLETYIMHNHFLRTKQIIDIDAESVLPFLETEFEPQVYRHCVIVHNYIDLLERQGEIVFDDLKMKFSTDIYRLSSVLIPKNDEMHKSGLEYQEYEKFKRDRLASHTAEYTLKDYSHFFEHCEEILGTLKPGSCFQLQTGVMNVLLSLAARDHDLFRQVIDLYFERNDPFKLQGASIVKKIIEQNGTDKAFQLLNKRKFTGRIRWLLNFHEVIPDADINKKWLQNLYDLYRSAVPTDLPYQTDYLLKFLSIDSRIIAKIISLLLAKSASNPDFIRCFEMIFNPYSDIAKKLHSIFIDDINILKKAYFKADELSEHVDYNGKIFNEFLNMDTNFAYEYITYKYTSAKKKLSSYDEQREYTFIWERTDYKEVMDRVVDGIIKHDKSLLISIDPYLMAFFQKSRGSIDLSEEVQKNQNAYLLKLIDDRNNDTDFIIYIFGLITQLNPDRRLVFIKHFVGLNKDFELFKQIPLEPSTWSWSGSQVPTLHRRLAFWDSLKSIMNTVDLLRHKHHIEKQIKVLKSEIINEKKLDFIDD